MTSFWLPLSTYDMTGAIHANCISLNHLPNSTNWEVSLISICKAVDQKEVTLHCKSKLKEARLSCAVRYSHSHVPPDVCCICTRRRGHHIAGKRRRSGGRSTWASRSHGRWLLQFSSPFLKHLKHTHLLCSNDELVNDHNNSLRKLLLSL